MSLSFMYLLNDQLAMRNSYTFVKFQLNFRAINVNNFFVDVFVALTIATECNGHLKNATELVNNSFRMQDNG